MHVHSFRVLQGNLKRKICCCTILFSMYCLSYMGLHGLTSSKHSGYCAINMWQKYDFAMIMFKRLDQIWKLPSMHNCQNGSHAYSITQWSKRVARLPFEIPWALLNYLVTWTRRAFHIFCLKLSPLIFTMWHHSW